MNYIHRETELKNMIPEDVKTILEIGSQNIGISKSSFKNDKWETTTIDIINADVTQDFNNNQKLQFDKNSFDLIIMTGILEHLVHVDTIIKESIRVTKKYILISLPNHACINNRISLLFGQINVCSNYDIIPLEYGGENYSPYGHKHYFSIRGAEQFVKWFYKGYKNKCYVFSCWGGKYLPEGFRNWLKEIKPSLFVGEVIYLIEKLEDRE